MFRGRESQWACNIVSVLNHWVVYFKMVKMVNFTFSVFYHTQKEVPRACWETSPAGSQPCLPGQEATESLDNGEQGGGGENLGGRGGWKARGRWRKGAACFYSWCWNPAQRVCWSAGLPGLRSSCVFACFLGMIRAGACLSWPLLNQRQALLWFGRKLVKLLPDICFIFLGNKRHPERSTQA